MPSFLARIFRNRPDTVSSLLSPDQFRKVLERERMRADRAGSPLSLLAITPLSDRLPRGPETTHQGSNPPDSPLAQPASSPWMTAAAGQLSAILARRLRATDVAGQLDDGRVGALLPNTPADAAWRVANEVREAFDATPTPLLCEVYVHPFPPSIFRHRQEQERPGVDGAGRTVWPLNQVLLKPLPWWKRALDVAGASTGLLLLSPLLAVAAIGIKLTSPGPIFFRQLRAGLGGKPFSIYKFRTMCLDAEQRKQSLQSQNEQDGPAFKIKNDPRVTTIGRYLRITCIDELPQLFNILVGDMTLVGPRPLPVDEAARCQDWEQRRLDVTPGLTCIWQAAGRRERISFADWMRMDLRYIKGRSVRKDLALLWQTFLNVIAHRGSH